MTYRKRSSVRSSIRSDSMTRRQLSVCIHSDDGSTIERLATKHECQKSLKEFNKETARYYSLSRGLGCSHDTDMLREELRRSRVRAYDLARQNRNRLLPHLRGLQPKNADQYEKLWNRFASGLDMLYIQLRRSLSIQREFPMHHGHTIFIRTGMIDPMLSRKASISVSIETVDIPGADRRTIEHEEFNILQREVDDLAELLEDMNQRVDVKPWTIEPEIDPSKFDCVSAASSNYDVILEVFEGDRTRKRRCICLLVVSVISIVIFASVLAVCMALLT
jgi:hypothetical protein